MKLSSAPPLIDQIPPPDEIVRRLGETGTERRLLRALLRVAKLKQLATDPHNSTKGDSQGGVRC
jgi:hypothetical protein